jgi:hypothetical protein
MQKKISKSIDYSTKTVKIDFNNRFLKTEIPDS